MLVLRSLVRDGIIPLLGPPTSIGDVHHGALYYYLLAPAAALTGGDSPLAVVAFIALAGIAAVGVTWWLARAIGGPVAGLVAGLAMAVSASAVDESTFIWNPNLIALSSAIALAGAWRAWTTRRPALVAAGRRGHCRHDAVPRARRDAPADRRRAAGRRCQIASGRTRPPRRVALRGRLGLAIIAISFLPLAIHELTSDFSEINAALDYLRSGGDPAAIGPVARLFVIGARVLSWPLTGLITDGAIAAVIAVDRRRPDRDRARPPRRRTRAPGGPLAGSRPRLDRRVPDRRRAEPGDRRARPPERPLPRLRRPDGLRAARPRRGRVVAGRIDRLDGPHRSRSARIATILGLGLLLAWNLGHQPPAVDPDGGFPAADRAAERIVAASGGGPRSLRSQPDFKSAEAYAYPLVRIGAPVRAIDRKARRPTCTPGSRSS